MVQYKTTGTPRHQALVWNSYCAFLSKRKGRLIGKIEGYLEEE